MDDPHVANPASSPISDPHQISSDPEPDEDDWDRDPVGAQEPSLELGSLDWSQINAEVDEFLNETDDDEDGRSEASVMRDGNISEDEARDETVSNSRSVDWFFLVFLVSHGVGLSRGSVNNSPKLNKKRLRSVTPSDGGGGTNDRLGSPLAKRKKLAAERTGYSRLKDSISANDLASEKANSGWPQPGEGMEEGDDEDEEEEDEEEEDDFLARELEEEWG